MDRNMKSKPTWWHLVDRQKNFHGNSDKFLKFDGENYDLLEWLHELNQSIWADLSDVDAYLDKLYKSKKLSLQRSRVNKARGYRTTSYQRQNYSDMDIARNHLLEDVFTRIYKSVVNEREGFEFFKRNGLLCVYDESLFLLLSKFITDTKRIESITFRDFLYEHSPNAYKDKDSEFYFANAYDDLDGKPTSDILEKEIETFRQRRYRIFSRNPSYFPRDNWSAIPKAREDEIAHIYKEYLYDPKLYYTTDLLGFEISDDSCPQYKKIKDYYKGMAKIKDVCKRISVLHNDRYNIRRLSPKDENYKIKLKKELNKFFSKVEKIKYKDFLELCRFQLSDIRKDSRFYGVRLYNFEVASRLRDITARVNELLRCGDDEAEADKILVSTVVLVDIVFPNVYNRFVRLFDDHEAMFYSVDYYKDILFHIVILGRLILDELVEKGYFGEEAEWEGFFLKKINEMAERVFYDPDKIEYTPNPESPEAQTAFEDILAAPAWVKYLINLAPDSDEWTMSVL